MATLREIRRRIGGVKSTQKITKAMKMVAAAKLRRAQDAVVSARPYARTMKRVLGDLSAASDVTANPLFAERPVERVAVVVVSADRGLCGAFNTNIIRAGASHIQQRYAVLRGAGNVRMVCVGRKGNDFFTRNGYPVDARHVGIFGALSFETARTIVAELTEGFLKGRYDRVDVVFNEFKSIVQQKIVVEQFLPIRAAEIADGGGEGAGAPAGGSAGRGPGQAATDYIYEPSAAALLEALVPKHLNFQMWRILLESNAAEQGARMSAMDNATTNASELIRDLQLSYNKARQASITKELLEIVSGAEALTKSA